ncbi:hypothetical protein MHBO_002106 [Bonamia ostreae]|uniref:Ribosomal protein S7 n=1 Tax=Bonamia ostreae TaxID=126728 RepID=A0ABV2AMA7_9EUKA
MNFQTKKELSEKIKTLINKNTITNTNKLTEIFIDYIEQNENFSFLEMENPLKRKEIFLEQTLKLLKAKVVKLSKFFKQKKPTKFFGQNRQNKLFYKKSLEIISEFVHSEYLNHLLKFYKIDFFEIFSLENAPIKRLSKQKKSNKTISKKHKILTKFNRKSKLYSENKKMSF